MTSMAETMAKFLLSASTSLHNGAIAKNPRILFPASQELSGASEFHRGMCAILIELHYELSQSAEGRKALADLGFEPLFEQVERPSGSGCND